MSGGGFWYMGGYALYVWSAYGMTALFLAAELVLLARRRRQLLERLEQMREIESEER